MRRFICLLLVFTFTLLTLPPSKAFSAPQKVTLAECTGRETKNGKNHIYDLVVFGGTPSGVAAAVTAASKGLEVILLSQGPVVGGAISNGLSATDVGSWEAVSGYPRFYYGLVSKFYKRVGSWRTEPKVAESIFSAELLTNGVTVRRNVTLGSVQILHNQISQLRLSDGQNYCGKVFVDATYTGDLLAMAKLKYHLTDGDLLSYHESQYRYVNLARILHFRGFTSSYVTKAFRNNPYIRSFKVPPTFKEIYKMGMPSMTYRLCVTKVKKNFLAFSKSSNYERWVPSWRILMKNYFNAANPPTLKKDANGSIDTKLWQFALLPNGKYDLNSGRSSFTNVPISLEYFEKSAERKQISRAFAEYLQDFIYFTQHDYSVPKLERKAIAGFGLCADEFLDNNHWPYEPYIRGGRRLIGMSTLTTKDIFLTREKSDSVAIGSYRLDMKPGMFVYSQGNLFQDWATFFKAPIYEIPFGAMLPRSGVGNLLTSVSISSSPLAFSSLRMEVQFMALGQAAGIAAWVAIKENRIFNRSMVTKIQAEQSRVGAIVKIRDICRLMNISERVKEHFDPQSCKPLVVLSTS